MKKEIVCIQCPKTCTIKVVYNERKEILSAEGNKCRRIGIEFAQAEIRSPSRILTTTVYIFSNDKEHPLLPVKSASPIPMESIKKVMFELANIQVFPPVMMGDKIAENVAGTGIDLIATAERLD
jgi:CxxC motif-containing protein